MLGLGLGLPYNVMMNKPILAQLGELTAGAYSFDKIANGYPNPCRVRDDTGAETDAGFVGTGLDVGLPVQLVNLLGATGNFGVDSNADGLADGWNSSNITSMSVSNNIQSFTPTVQYGSISQNINSVYNNKYYVCAYINCSKFPISLQISDNPLFLDANTTSSSTTGYEFKSHLFTKTTNDSSFTIKVLDNSASGFVPINVKRVYVFDLTAIFGAGNEPTSAAMDYYMQQLTLYFENKQAYIANSSKNGLLGWCSRDLLESYPLGVDSNTDGVSDGWTLTYSAGYTTTGSCSGNEQVLNLTESAGYNYGYMYRQYNVIPGTVVKYTGECKVVSGNVRSRLELRYYNGSTYLSASTGNDYLGTTYTTQTVVGTVPASATNVRICVVAFPNGGAGSTGLVSYRNVEAKITNNSAYLTSRYDQSLVTSSGNLLASVPLGVDGNANGVSDGWSSYNSPNLSGVVRTANTSVGQSHSFSNSTAIGSTMDNNISVNCAPGNVFTFMCYVKIESLTGIPFCRIRVQFKDSGSSTLTTITSTSLSSTTDYVLLTATGTAPANTVSARLLVESVSGAVGDSILAYFKDATSEISNYTGGNHAVQSTQANQPRLVNQGVLEVDGNGKPRAVCQDSTDQLLATNINTPNVFTVAFVGNTLGSTNIRMITLTSNTPANNSMVFPSVSGGTPPPLNMGERLPNQYYASQPNNGSPSTIPLNLIYTRTGPNYQEVLRNGADKVVDTAQTTANFNVTRIYLGADSVGGAHYEQDFIVFINPLSESKKLKLAQNINKRFKLS